LLVTLSLVQLAFIANVTRQIYRYFALRIFCVVNFYVLASLTYRIIFGREGTIISSWKIWLFLKGSGHSQSITTLLKMRRWVQYLFWGHHMIY